MKLSPNGAAGCFHIWKNRYRGWEGGVRTSECVGAKLPSSCQFDKFKGKGLRCRCQTRNDKLGSASLSWNCGATVGLRFKVAGERRSFKCTKWANICTENNPQIISFNTFKIQVRRLRLQMVKSTHPSTQRCRGLQGAQHRLGAHSAELTNCARSQKLVSKHEEYENPDPITSI